MAKSRLEQLKNDKLKAASSQPRAAPRKPKPEAPTPDPAAVQVLGMRANDQFPTAAAVRGLVDGLMRETGGKSICTSDQSGKRVVGIALPSLAARLLYGQDVWALGRSEMIYGTQGSCKSAFLAERFRWVLSHNGMCAMAENENKDSPDLRNSIVGHDDPTFPERIVVKQTTNQEQWMEFVEVFVDLLTKKFSKEVDAPLVVKRKKDEDAASYKARKAPKENKGAPGWIVPIVVGLDSITATRSKKTIQDMKDDGAPKRRFAMEANFLSDWMGVLPDRLQGRPINFVSVNHFKPVTDPNTGLPKPDEGIPGGRAPRFMDTTEIFMRKIGYDKKDDSGGVRLRVAMTKNSLHETGSVIEITLKWWWERDDETGDFVQRTVWDWGRATVDALFAINAKSKTKFKAVMDLVDLRPVKGNRVWSKTLGIPEARPVPYTNAGDDLESHINEHREFRKELYGLLHVERRTVFTPGVEYDLIEEHITRMLEDTRPVYHVRDLSGVAFIDDAIEAAAKAGKKRKKPKPVETEDEDDAET